ncbi:MAG: isochorismatase family protein [Pirellulaceae bacterium]|jgi:nicotinamidase-related amidase|nr:isochorismatase family protein [Pirellulaceae bacterium]MDP7015705.1 isochorismatase family protein [Pirellulaceae bacterium]
MIVLLIVDMQCGMVSNGVSPTERDVIAARIHGVAESVRAVGGRVVFIRHEGPAGDSYAPGNADWEFVPSLTPLADDHVVAKTTCDAFYDTTLNHLLTAWGVDELIICGWATDFCVDTTVRAAVSHNYSVTVVSDGHTAADRPHLSAVRIVEHHNAVWTDLLTPGRAIRVAAANALAEELGRIG